MRTVEAQHNSGFENFLRMLNPKWVLSFYINLYINFVQLFKSA